MLHNLFLLLCLAMFFQDDVHIVPRGPIKPAPATTWDAKTPFELKGSRAGAPRKEIQENIKSKLLLDGWTQPPLRSQTCDDRLEVDKSTNGTFECFVTRGTFVRGQGAAEYMHWSFVEDRLAVVFYSFKHDDYAAIRDALIEKYGQPTTTDVATYQNAYGAKWQGAVLDWKNQVSTIRLTEYSGQRTKSSVIVSDDQLLPEYQARKPKKKVDI